MNKLTTLSEIEQIVKRVQYGRGPWTNYWEFYRGQGSDRFKLQPGIFRDKGTEASYLKEEKRVFKYFQKKAASGTITVQDSFQKSKYPHAQTWFSLFQAQHLGLKTRLLDWTIKWQMAVLFAVENEALHNEDGQFWVLKCPPDKLLKDDSPQILNGSPFDVQEFYTVNYPFFYEPENEHYTAEHRRQRQWGRFSIQPIGEGITPIEEQAGKQEFFEKYIIDKNAKLQLKKELEKDGFTIDWIYYRSEENISKVIKRINKPSFFRRLFGIY